MKLYKIEIQNFLVKGRTIIDIYDVFLVAQSPWINGKDSR